MKLRDLVQQSASGREATVRRLLRVDERDVSLKGIFDHVMNYAICAGVLAVANHLGKSGEPLGAVLAAALIVVFFALLALNVAQGLVLASALGIRRWAGMALGVLMVLGTYVRLKRQGIVPVFSVDEGPQTAFYYEDPDGNCVELNVTNYTDRWSALDHMQTSEAFARPKAAWGGSRPRHVGNRA